MKRKGNVDSWDDVEFLIRKGARVANPKVTLTDHHTILFNAALYHRAKLEGKTHVRIGYSEKKNAIVFDFTEDPKAEGAFRLIPRRNTASTGCRSFFNAYDLDAKKIAGRYIPHKERIPKVGLCWFIKLDEKIEE